MSSLGDEEALPPPIKVAASRKRRNLPGRPDPDAEVIALSPKSLLTTNRFVCEICSKGFQRDQNLQLHRRGHNLPWRLKQKESHEYRKKVYICPELNCVHHDPARALGDLTGIKKHFSRKHGEKKWNCEKCSKRYAVQSDWKAHQKTCGTKEYRCDCGYLFSRKDSFISHRAFCDMLENSKDPPCNDEQAQKPAASPDEIDNKNTIMSDMPASMDAAASPASLVSGGDGPTRTEFQEPIPTERVFDPALPESGIASLSTKCMQGDIGANNCRSNQGSELSLCLGTDRGPGPPSNAQVIGTHNTPVPIFGFLSPRGSNKLESPQLASSETQVRSKHVPSKGAMGMLASLFSSSARCQSGVDGSDSIANGFPMRDQDSFSLSAGLSSSAYGPSKAFLHAASAATSATALLQKAAELGAKASNPSMFEWYETVGRDSNLSRNRQGTPRESSWTGLGDSYLISLQSKATQSEDYVKSTEFYGSTSSSRKVAGLHTKGLSDGVCFPGSSLLNVPFEVNMQGNSSALSKHAHIKRKSNLSTKLCDSGFGEKGCHARQEGGGSQTSESEKQMVDFLGVNSTRSSAGMGQLLPHRDLESMTAGIRVPKSFHYPNSSIG